MLELNGLLHAELPPLALRGLVARMAHKSWAVSVNNSLSLTPVSRQYTVEEELLSVFEPYINSKIALDLAYELDHFPFAGVRLANGITFAIPDSVRKNAEILMNLSPADWFNLSFRETPEKLLATVTAFPQFAPAWHFLAEEFSKRGEPVESEKARGKFTELRAQQWTWV